MSDEKRAIKVKFPEFDMNIDNSYQEELDKLIDIDISEATTTRTLKNITETLSKALKSKYDITDKEELKTKIAQILKLHGLHTENFDPISFISKQVFGNLKTVNDVSIDDNANKTDTNMTGVCLESFLPYQKLAGYDFLYQTIKELYGRNEAKKCTADMYDFSLALNDSTKILIPYCYCIDASKIVTEGRNFGQVHSSPAHRISTYISILGDTIREMSFNVAGAIAVGTLFLDVCHLAIYRERITLDDLRTDKKVRKAMTNHFQQFIHTVNHYSRNAVESPFTNVSCFDRDKLSSLIDDDNYGWYFPKKAAIVEDNNLEDTKDAFKNFILDYIEELQEIYIDVFDEGDPLRGGLQYPFPVTTCLPADTPLILNKQLITFGEAFSDFEDGWTEVEDLYTIYQGKEIKINKVFRGETTKLLEFSGMHGWPIKSTPDHKFVLASGEKIKACDIKVGDKLMIDRNSKIQEFSKDHILVSDYIKDLWVQGYQLEYTDKVKSLFDFQKSNNSYPELNAGNIKKSFRFDKIQQLSEVDFRLKPEIDMVRTKESKNKGNIPNKIKLDNNFGRFLGLYYAEGHNSDGELGFSLNENETEYIDFIVNYLKDVLQLKSTIRKSNSKGVQICIYSRTLGVLLDTLIGKYCYGKRIHSDLFDSPIDFREGLIRGIIEGDGNCASCNCGITTTSKEGANSIGYLFTTLGVSTKLSIEQPRFDEKRKIKGKHIQYYIDVNKFDIINNNYNFGKTSNFVLKKRIMKPNCFLVKKITEINTQETIYNIEVDNQEHLYTLPFGLVTSNCNFGTTKDENGKSHLTYENNKLLDYITKHADISRYNIYCSEGTKVTSCCRLISDSDFLAYAGGVNSFGGSQVSLGSHRVVTINFARCAYEASSYDDFKKIVSERAKRMGKILKAHRVLILKLEQLGKQPWITNGWIDMTHMFSTFGCAGYLEASEILKAKFNHVDFDYMKDFLVYFNDECKKVADEENIIFNIEAIPAESMAPKLAQADIIICGDEDGNYNFE